MMRSLLLCSLGAAAHAFQATGRFARPMGPATRMMSSFHDFEVKTLAGDAMPLSAYKGKPTLVVNVASLWGTTTADFTKMNALKEQFGDDLAVIGFPCNQFGHQTNEGEDEFLNTLKYVRPGDGFEFKGDFTSKVNVNGAQADPVWKWMRSELKAPCDSDGDTKGNGADDADVLILPRGGFDSTTVSTWTPVTRTDVAWNFEKFLIDGEGNAVKRYSRFYDIAAIAKDIEALLPVAA